MPVFYTEILDIRIGGGNDIGETDVFLYFGIKIYLKFGVVGQMHDPHGCFI